MADAYGELPSGPGPIVLVAQLYASPGQADLAQKLLSDVQRVSVSDQEPGCLEYRTTRSFVADSSGVTKFVVFERYQDADAINAHFKSPEFNALVAKVKEGLLTAPPTIQYFSEFKS